MQKITPFLWFDGQAEEAAQFYVSVFKDAEITGLSRYTGAGPGEPGTVLTVSFTLAGQSFTALNGGPDVSFTHAISFVVNCDTQDEIDYYWEKLSEGGEIIECGWLKDKYGVSWQIVPSMILEWVSEDDPERSQRVMEAILKMKKLDLATLERAAAGDD